MNKEDKKLLKAGIRKMNQATNDATKSLDDTLSFVKKSNQRIKEMESSRFREAHKLVTPEMSTEELLKITRNTDLK